MRGKVTPAACDLNSLLPKVKPATLLSIDDVVTTVRDVASAASAGGSRLANADPTASLKLNYAAEGQPDPLCGLRRPHRPRKRHAAAQDNEPGDGRQRLE